MCRCIYIYIYKCILIFARKLLLITGFRKPDPAVVKAIQARCEMFAADALQQAASYEKDEEKADAAGWKA